MQNFEIFEPIRDAMDCTNDQLRVIANWPDRASQKEDALVQEVITQVQSIPQLSVEDSAKCMMVMA